jgi:thiamine pyrophosphate-dependent acetolactate synthase large subunit-like protein
MTWRALLARPYVLDMIKKSKRPVIYAGGGCLDASPELVELVRATGIPVCQTLMVGTGGLCSPRHRTHFEPSLMG